MKRARLERMSVQMPYLSAGRFGQRAAATPKSTRRAMPHN